MPNCFKRFFLSINTSLPSSIAIEGIYGKIFEELLPEKKYTEEVIDIDGPIVEASKSGSVCFLMTGAEVKSKESFEAIREPKNHRKRNKRPRKPKSPPP